MERSDFTEKKGCQFPRNKSPFVKLSHTKSGHVSLDMLAYSQLLCTVQTSGKDTRQDLSTHTWGQNRREEGRFLKPHSRFFNLPPSSQGQMLDLMRTVSYFPFSQKTCCCKSCIFPKPTYIKQLKKMYFGCGSRSCLKSKIVEFLDS